MSFESKLITMIALIAIYAIVVVAVVFFVAIPLNMILGICISIIAAVILWQYIINVISWK